MWRALRSRKAMSPVPTSCLEGKGPILESAAFHAVAINLPLNLPQQFPRNFGCFGRCGRPEFRHAARDGTPGNLPSKFADHFASTDATLLLA